MFETKKNISKYESIIEKFSMYNYKSQPSINFSLGKGREGYYSLMLSCLSLLPFFISMSNKWQLSLSWKIILLRYETVT